MICGEAKVTNEPAGGCFAEVPGVADKLGLVYLWGSQGLNCYEGWGGAKKKSVSAITLFIYYSHTPSLILYNTIPTYYI